MAIKKDEIAELENRVKALEKENQSLKNIIYKAPIPLFVVDKAHTITHFNQALEELSGYSAKEMIGTKNQWKAFYKSERPVMADLIIDRSSDAEIIKHYGLKYNRARQEKDRFSATDFFQDLGEEGKWLFFSASVFTDSQGNLSGAVETLQDVTEEKIAERKTKELFRIYRRILEFIPYPIVVYDEKGKVSYINPAFSATFGWSLENIKGRPIPFVPESLKAETSDMLDKLNQDKSLVRYETQRLTKDNKVLDVVLWAASNVRFKTGEIENFVILRDVTKEKRIQANNQTIMRISSALPEYPELEDLMDFISKEVKDILNSEGAIVLLHDELKEELFFTGVSYDNLATEKRARKIRFSLDSLLAGEIIKTGEYILENDSEKLTKGYSERDEKLGYKTKSLLEVPIKSDGRIIGVLCAINKKQNLFDENDLELMVMIAGTIAISIENARFADALQKAYRDVASMNRAKGKAINHLSHELKTPVAVLTGSFKILKRKLESVTAINVTSTLNRIERNLNRVVDIQDEVADIMEDKTYSAQKIMLNMLEACKDELGTLIEKTLMDLPASQIDIDQTSIQEEIEKSTILEIENSIRESIDEEFGPKSLFWGPLNFSTFFNTLYADLEPKFSCRNIHINMNMQPDLPTLILPEKILEKMISGLIKNAVENTPDNGRIDLIVSKKDQGILFKVHDFGVGIEEDAQKRIFEGFFTTQKTMDYSTKTPFTFNAGGKGADLLRMKIFSSRHGFVMKMQSSRCSFLIQDAQAVCPGNIKDCDFCNSQKDCLNSGYSIFSVFFPPGHK
ncbi:MAG: PAS domain S-box protein [Pseudomonadota bacterium]